MDKNRAERLFGKLGMKLIQLQHDSRGWQLQRTINGEVQKVREFRYFSEVARYLDGTLMEVALMQSFYEELLQKSAAWESKNVWEVMEWLADKGAPYPPALKDLQSINRPLPSRWRSRAAAVYEDQLTLGTNARRITRAKTLGILQTTWKQSVGDHDSPSPRDTQLTSIDIRKDAS
ncbi:hypothetical protein AB8810_16080 [Xanthomonas sp. NCPPB 3005]|uniref:hypothetical protein n=1 Tax=Xanthomonas sp. NCPPB 3005 TaxID=3240913 RepID=UPI0035149C80